MNRLAVKYRLPLDIQQIVNTLMDSEGLCTCGRVMRKIDAKLVLMTAVPSQGQFVIGAYCLPCSRVINSAMKSCGRVLYSGTETAPVDRGIKTL